MGTSRYRTVVQKKDANSRRRQDRGFSVGPVAPRIGASATEPARSDSTSTFNSKPESKAFRQRLGWNRAREAADQPSNIAAESMANAGLPGVMLTGTSANASAKALSSRDCTRRGLPRLQYQSLLANRRSYMTAILLTSLLMSRAQTLEMSDAITRMLPYHVLQPWHLKTMLLRHGAREPIKNTFQQLPRQLLKCSRCTFDREVHCIYTAFSLKNARLEAAEGVVVEDMFLSQPPARSVTFAYSTVPLFGPSLKSLSMKSLEREVEDELKLRDIRKALRDVGDDQEPISHTNVRSWDRNAAFPSEATWKDMEANGELTCHIARGNVRWVDADWRDFHANGYVTHLGKMTLEDTDPSADLMSLTDVQHNLPEIQFYSPSDPAYTFRYARSRADTEHGSGVKEPTKTLISFVSTGRWRRIQNSVR